MYIIGKTAILVLKFLYLSINNLKKVASKLLYVFCFMKLLFISTIIIITYDIFINLYLQVID